MTAEMLPVIESVRRESRLTIVLVERNVAQSLTLAHRGNVLENGGTVLSGSRIRCRRTMTRTNARDLMDPTADFPHNETQPLRFMENRGRSTK